MREEHERNKFDGVAVPVMSGLEAFSYLVHSGASLSAWRCGFCLRAFAAGEFYVGVSRAEKDAQDPRKSRVIYHSYV